MLFLIPFIIAGALVGGAIGHAQSSQAKRAHKRREVIDATLRRFNRDLDHRIKLVRQWLIQADAFKAGGHHAAAQQLEEQALAYLRAFIDDIEDL